MKSLDDACGPKIPVHRVREIHDTWFVFLFGLGRVWVKPLIFCVSEDLASYEVETPKK